jgi:MFS family permease
LFVFGVSQISKFGLKSPLVYLFVGIGLSSLVAFTFIERKAKDPIVDLSIFKNQDFSYAFGSLFLTFVATPFFVLCMPFFLMQGIGLSSATAGMLFAVVSMATILGGPVSGWLTDRFGPVWFSTIGAAAIAAAFVFMLGFDLQTTVRDIVPILGLMGIGIGTYQAPNSSSIMGAVTKDRLGTASALTATGRQVGFSVGMALAGTIFTARRLIHETDLGRQGMETLKAPNLAISEAFHDGLLVGLFLQLLVVFLCLRPGRKRSNTPIERKSPILKGQKTDDGGQ